MKVDIIDIKLIKSGERIREDLGDLHELSRSIKERGLIQPIAVRPEGGGYELLAGGRRLEACKIAGISTIPVRIYDEPLSELERKSIELEENIRRKDLTFREEVNLQREIHNLQVAIHGPKLGGTRSDLNQEVRGHSVVDTANLLGRSPQSVRDDIKLAEAMEQFPELGWDKCKNKTEAVKLMSRTEESIIRAELAKRATSALSKEKSDLVNKYVVGDFFKMAKQIPNGVMDLVEVDPPFGIALPDVKSNFGENVDSWYNEVNISDYPKFLDELVYECWRVMNDRSWLIFWFAPEPWFDIVFSTLIKHGFKGRRMTAKWVKTGTPGQTRNPEYNLGNAVEEFFYMRKGDASINTNKRGRSNVFDFPVVPAQRKVHPTEKPIPLMKEILNTFAYPGNRILVPFAGSGNTILSALELQMDAVGYDLAKEGKEGYVLKLMGGGGVI